AHPTRVGSGKIGAGDQCIGLPGSPLVGPQCRAPPLRRLAFGRVEPGARHRDLHPTKGPQQGARSVTVPVASDTARALSILGICFGAASVARERRLDPRSAFSTFIPPSTIPSTLNDISSLGRHFGSSEPKQAPGGKMRLPSHETGFDLANS